MHGFMLFYNTGQQTLFHFQWKDELYNDNASPIFRKAFTSHVSHQLKSLIVSQFCEPLNYVLVCTGPYMIYFCVMDAEYC